MPKIVVSLTDSKIRSTISQSKKSGFEKALKLSDGQGLYLYIDKNGGTFWRFDYTRPIIKKRNTISIGKYPDISLAEARQYRDKFRSDLAKNIDPQAERKKEELAKLYETKNTFEAIARDYMKTESLAESTEKRNQFVFDYLFKAIGNKPINDITAGELLHVCQLYENIGKTDTAKRMRSKASQVFRYAIALGICHRNVANDISGIIKSKKAKHYSAITDPELLGQLLTKIDTYKNKGSISIAYALRILPHVFVRPGDLRFAKWADIDFEKRTWSFTPQKTENAHNIELIVPLSDQVHALFKELYLLNGNNEYCFWSHSKSGVVSDSSINKALKNCGFENGETTGHGFRATARTILDEVLRYPIERIEQQLGHTVRDMNGRAYNRTTYLEERTNMMQAWSDYLNKLKLDNKFKNL